MEGDCHIFLIFLVYRFITWYTRYINSISILISLLFSEKPDVTITNECVIPGISQKNLDLFLKTFSLLPVFMLHHRNLSILECQISAV